jgi:hypothetical protein
MSNLTTGRRLVPRAGEAHLTPARYLPFKSFGHGSLYYSVQTVDQAYQGSPWASEERLTIGPELALIQDVPGDQGGKVRLSIDKSLLDDEARTVTPATGYNVWRLVPSAAVARAVAREGRALEPARATARLQGDSVRPGAGPRAEERPATDAAEATDLALIEWNGRTFTHSAGQSIASPFPAGTWEILGSFFATQQPNYVFVASTLADSGSSGPNTESFIVTVHTTTPSMWFASPPASGRSVDNIPPAPPVGLTAAHHTGSGNQLSWQPSAENDFAGFRVYRGTSPGFVADPSTLAASVTNPAWTDPSYDAPIVFYKVSTLDDAGNESAAVPPTTLVATEGTGLPLEFALHAAAPNPSGARMRIGFALPSAQRVRLEVFDAAGRLVRTLVDGELPAGEHEARWHGENASGHRTGAGMFFLRLRAGSFEATRRVVRIE